MTQQERYALEGLGLFVLQHVPCADREDELVVRQYTELDDGRVVINARCPKCGAVATATVTRAALADHLAEAPTFQDILSKDKKQ